MKTKKLLSILITLVIVLAIAPVTALAAPGDTWPEAIKLNVGVKNQVGKGPTIPCSDDKRFYLDVAAPSVVVLELSTQGPGPAGEEWKGNRLQMHLMYGDADAGRYDLNNDDIPRPEVESIKMPLAKDYTYKLMPGRYYVRVWETSAINCFGWVTLKSVTPAKGQTEPKDNYTPTQGLANAAIVPGKTYDGLINWKAKLPEGTDKYGQYAYNYYKYVVKNDNTTLKLTASRADQTRNNNLCIELCKTDGWRYGYNSLSLNTFPSGEALFKDIPAGTYLINVNGWPANCFTTEYSFKVEEIGASVTGVSLPKTKTVDKGKTVKLTPGVKPSGAANKAVTWKSSNTGVAKVDANGVVSGIKGGTATITVTTVDGKKTAVCTVTVKAPATKLTLNKTSTSIKKGKTLALKIKKFTPADVYPKTLTWSSSKKSVAKVDKNGKVTAVKKGTATITAKSWNGKTAKCKVTVK